MIDKKMEDTINTQINKEMFSAYLYYSMAAYCDSISLGGFAHWLRAQALEEFVHAQKFVAYLADRGGQVLLQKIDAPRTEWDSIEDLVAQVLEHEIDVTDLINELMDLAMSIRDHASVGFLQWFVTEQVEEVASADELVQKVKLVHKTDGGIFMLDQEMAKRPLPIPPEFTA